MLVSVGVAVLSVVCFDLSALSGCCSAVNPGPMIANGANDAIINTKENVIAAARKLHCVALLVTFGLK